MGKHKKHKNRNRSPYMDNYDDVTGENNNFNPNNLGIGNFDINNLTSMLNNIDINQITSLLNILSGGKREQKDASSNVEEVSDVENIKDINDEWSQNDYDNINLDEVNNIESETNIYNDHEVKKSKSKRKKRELKADDEIVSLLLAIKAIADTENSKKIEKLIKLYIDENNEKTSL